MADPAHTRPTGTLAGWLAGRSGTPGGLNCSGLELLVAVEQWFMGLERWLVSYWNASVSGTLLVGLKRWLVGLEC